MAGGCCSRRLGGQYEFILPRPERYEPRCSTKPWRWLVVHGLTQQVSEQQDSVIADVLHTSISVNPERSNEGQLDRNPAPREADIPEVPIADRTGTPTEDTTPSSQRVTVMPDPLGLLELWSGGKVQDPLRHKAIDLFNEVCDDLGIGSEGR